MPKFAGGIKEPADNNELESIIRKIHFRYISYGFNNIESVVEKREPEPHITSLDSQISSHLWAQVKKTCCDLICMGHNRECPGHISDQASAIRDLLSGLGH